MTAHEFARRVANTRMRIDDLAAGACRLVLVEGMKAAHVAKKTGIAKSQISKALQVIAAAKPAKICPHCGTKL